MLDSFFPVLSSLQCQEKHTDLIPDMEIVEETKRTDLQKKKKIKGISEQFEPAPYSSGSQLWGIGRLPRLSSGLVLSPLSSHAEYLLSSRRGCRANRSDPQAEKEELVGKQ